MLKSLRFLLLVVVVVVLGGCASMKMSAADRANLKRVYIAEIRLPEKPTILAPSAGVGFLLAGPIGVAIANGATDLPSAYKDLVARNQIDIAGGIKRAFQSRLNAKGIHVVATEAEADASLVVEVLHYGLTGTIFSGERFPQLWAKVRLTNRSGEVIWKQMMAAHVSQDVIKNVEARPISGYFEDRTFLEHQIGKVTDILVESAVDTL